jgi:phage gp36-like protein
MAYCTLADIKDQLEEAILIQLTDDDETDAVDEDRVERAISDADQEIDGYVGSRHTVPLDPVPPIVRKLSVDVSIYNLYSRRNNVPELRSERYKNAVRFLEQVAVGKISLGASDPEGSPPRSDAPELSVDNPERLFTRDSMEGF